MVQINFAQKQVNAKVVYYGPGMSGKTTNLEIVHQRAPAPNRGDLTSISTDGDRTLFFDFMPLDLGTVAGMRTCFQLYTVPGQVYYNSTRKLVLQGVDGVVFVADSSASMVEENLESMRNLEQNLAEYGKSLATMPLIIQYNKRDLPDALPVEELQRLLNPYGAPCYEAIANTGQGVFPTLKALAARVLESIHTGSRSNAPQAGIQAGLGQTGFHPAPHGGGAPIPRTLQQTGYHAAPMAQPMSPQIAPQMTPQMTPQMGAQRAVPMQPGAQVPNGPQMVPGQTGYHESLARTVVHAPPMQPGMHSGMHSGMQPGMQPGTHSGMHSGMQPGMQSGMHAGMQSMPMQQPTVQGHMPQQHMHGQQPGMMHPQMHVPGPIPQHTHAAMHQTGYGYAPQGQPGMQSMMQPQHGMQPMQSAPATLMAPQAQAPQGGIQMLRVDKGGAGAPTSAQKPRPVAAKPTAPVAPPAAAETGARIQPRNQPMATPGSGKKRLVYTAVFIVVALGVGAFVAKMVLSVL